MTALVIAALLAMMLIITGWLGPRFLCAAAPALAHAPRLAVTVLTFGIITWAAGAVVLGPLIAWAGTGPQLLGDEVALVCSRCLEAASPWGLESTNRILPASVLLASALLLLLTLISAFVVVSLRTRQQAGRLARTIAAHGRGVTVQDTTLTLVEDRIPTAFVLPKKYGGIVLSTGALEVLTEAELTSVLAHEKAHVSQRHHQLSQLVAALRAVLGWVPMIRSASMLITDYLEIAADHAACRQQGPRPLAGALLKLGAPNEWEESGKTPAAILGASGQERISHLVAARSPKLALWPLFIASVAVLVLAVASLGVALPYAELLLTGCRL